MHVKVTVAVRNELQAILVLDLDDGNYVFQAVMPWFEDRQKLFEYVVNESLLADTVKNLCSIKGEAPEDIVFTLDDPTAHPPQDGPVGG